MKKRYIIILFILCGYSHRANITLFESNKRIEHISAIDGNTAMYEEYNTDIIKRIDIGRSVDAGDGILNRHDLTVYLSDTIPIKDCEIKDISDVSKELFHKKNKGKQKKDKTPRSQKKVNTLILPVFAYNPASGMQLGASASSALYLGAKENTRISFAGVKLAVTTESQFISFLITNLYTNENKFFFQGDWRYLKFSQTTYGLGTNAPEEIDLEPSWGFQGIHVGEDEGGDLLSYDYIKFHEIANRKVSDNFYVGLGYELDIYKNIEDPNLDTVSNPKVITSHFGYSTLHGFDPQKYTLSGVSINAMFDSRDNQINAYKGYFARINYRMNPTFLGSSQNSTQLWTEFRTYVGLSKKIPRHLIAFWYFGNFLVSGEQPYLTLMATAQDLKQKSGRGYVFGRFRGEDFMYAEAEYRFPLMRCAQTLGGVLFVNASTASNRDANVHLFDYVEPAVGFGIRLLMNKFTRMEISIDFAYGFGSKGTYFGGGETF